MITAKQAVELTENNHALERELGFVENDIRLSADTNKTSIVRADLSKEVKIELEKRGFVITSKFKKDNGYHGDYYEYTISWSKF
jgi:hypothetical protein